jgi:hypothetical protein
MKHITVTNGNFEAIDFVPSVIIGFFRSDEEALFVQEYKMLKSRYPDADIIGCSSSSNISNIKPYIERYGEKFPTVYFCCDMERDAFGIRLYEADADVEEEDMHAQMILLSSFSSVWLEQLLSGISERIESPKVFGGVASVKKGESQSASIFYNGVFYPGHMIAWHIDPQKYVLEGVSIHLFRPAGIPLEITKAKGKTIIELNNLPALDVVEEITGMINETVIGRFGYPLFLQKEASVDWKDAPLASIVSVDRKRKSITVYRNIHPKEYVKVGIMLSKTDQIRRISRIYGKAPSGSAALLFHCIGIEENLKMMEYLYLEDIKHHIDISFTGFHTFGEIGPSASRKGTDKTMLHNQTMTIAMIAKKESL